MAWQAGAASQSLIPPMMKARISFHFGTYLQSLLFFSES